MARLRSKKDEPVFRKGKVRKEKGDHFPVGNLRKR